MTDSIADKKSRFVESLWPTVTDAASARKIARYGAWICWWLAVLNLFLAINKWVSGGAEEAIGFFFLPALYVLLGTGVWKMSRLAAVVAMAVWGLSQSLDLVVGYQRVSLTYVMMACLYFSALACGIRGTLAYVEMGGATSANQKWKAAAWRGLKLSVVILVLGLTAVMVIGGIIAYLEYGTTG